MLKTKPFFRKETYLLRVYLLLWLFLGVIILITNQIHRRELSAFWVSVILLLLSLFALSSFIPRKEKNLRHICATLTILFFFFYDTKHGSMWAKSLLSATIVISTISFLNLRRWSIYYQLGVILSPFLRFLYLHIYRQESPPPLLEIENPLSIPFYLLLLLFLSYLKNRSNSKERGDLLAENLQMKEKIFLDEPTGLLNKRALENYFANRELNETDITVLMLDIDDFKAYNDLYGHLKGDDSLKEVAQTLKSVAKRTSDKIFRFGGEEFLVLLESTPEENAIHIAKEIQQHILANERPHEHSSTGDFLTVSIGIAKSERYSSGHTGIIQRADDALYKAKREGKNVAYLQREGEFIRL